MARVGKIARLPKTVREELNRKLDDGRPGPELLPWLNGLPEVQSILSAEFSGAPISAQNLSDWRHGGYEDWCRSQDRFAGTKLLAERAREFAATAGGSLSEASAQILSGKILNVLEGLAEAEDLEALSSLVKPVATLRRGDIERQRADQDRQRLAQKDEEIRLAKQKYQDATCERYLDEAKRAEAERIAGSDLSHAEKIAALRQTFFADIDQLQASGAVVIPQ